MSLWLVELKFTSALHLGKAGIGMEAVETLAHSDTLFSGICYAWSAVYGKDAATQLLEGFCSGSPPFRITSAFPYKDNTYFLPRPLIPAKLPGDEAEGASVAKELNRLPFVPMDVFRQWTRGALGGVEPVPIKDKLAAAAVYHMVPRVQLDRVTCASGLFHAGMTVFGKDAGLYCLVDAGEDMKNKLEGVFNWLGDSGLGGMRSLGCGKFTARWTKPGGDWDGLLESGRATGAWCLLSLAHPSPEERRLSLDSASFEIITREGWAASPFTLRQTRRKSCKMFAEGSVIPYLPKGCMVDVTPAGWDSSLHPLYRYGYAFAVPVEVTK